MDDFELVITQGDMTIRPEIFACAGREGNQSFLTINTHVKADERGIADVSALLVQLNLLERRLYKRLEAIVGKENVENLLMIAAECLSDNVKGTFKEELDEMMKG